MPEDSGLSIQSRPLIKNLILNALPEVDYNRLLPNLKLVQLTLGQIIYHPEEPIKYLYFPDSTTMISVIATTMEGQSAEVGVIGYEGIVGMDALMGADWTLNENLVQNANDALQISVDAIKEEFKRGGALHDSLLHFTRLLMIQISQTALCNRLHTVNERLARWLLLCRDRTESDKLQLTQEFLAIMLGANRATVTMSAIALQNAGYINYSRGRITITDRQKLEDFACNCYQTVKKEYDRFQKQQMKNIN